MLITGAGGMCALRARLGGDDARAWVLLASGLLAWAATELYQAAAARPDVVLSDTGFFIFYVSSFAALVLRLQRAPRRWAALPDALISFLGLASLWSLFVLEHVLTHPGGHEQTVIAAYAVLDLLGMACAVALVARGGWQLARADCLLLIGLGVIVVGDSFFLNAAVHGGYERGSALDALWPAGAVLIAAAGWVSPTTQVPDRFAGVSVSLAISVAATVSAGAILVVDHFHRIETLTLVIVVSTLVTAMANAVAIHIERDRTAVRLRDEAMRTVTALALAVDAKDRHTRHHSERVACYAVELGERLGLSTPRLKRLEIAGRLHDVGKIAVPDAILLKPSKLDTDEFEQVKQHSAEGERLARGAGLLDIATWIRHHHERWDGTGYPDALRGHEIPLESRILAAADALDAMTSDRSYRGALDLAHARAEIAASAGTQFDPDVANALLAITADGDPGEPGDHEPAEVPVAPALATG
jgi:HD-GYP domain-containing protein (c-di-GMP phosphodiesterase class II)